MVKITICNKTILNKISIIAFLCYCFLGVVINSTYAENNFYRLLINIFRGTIFVILFLDSIVNHFYLENKIKMVNIISLLIGIVNFVVTHNYKILIFSLFLLWSQYYSLKELMNKSKNVFYVAIIFVVVSSIIGIIPNYTNQRNNSDSIRWCLGFIAPTLLPAYFMFAILMDCYVNEFELGYIKIILYLLILSAIYLATGTRFDCIISLIVLILSMILTMRKKSGSKSNKLIKNNFINNVRAKILCLLPIMCFIFELILILGYKNDINFFRIIADHLSGRIQYTIKVTDTHSLLLFGENVTWASEGIILDSSYFKCLYENGIIAFLFIMFFYILLLRNAIKKGDKAMLLIVSIILFESIFEPFLFDYNYNLFPLYLVNLSPVFCIKTIKQNDNYLKLLFLKI